MISDESDSIIRENRRRNKELKAPYDPVRGIGCQMERVPLCIDDYGNQIKYIMIPKIMMEEPLIAMLYEYGSFRKVASIYSEKFGKKITAEDIMLAYITIRVKYDFEFWAFSFVKIKPKAKAEDFMNTDGKQSVYDSHGLIPFKLNRGQRKYLGCIIDDFFAKKPIRVILLKARQWGGSTLTQIFMMWMQLIHIRNWNSVICAHIENSARIIKGMYDIALREMPYVIIEEAEEPLYFTPYQGSTKTRIIPQRGCRITIGSAEKPEGLRGEDLSMAHFSEVASYKSTEQNKPEDLVQSIVSGINPTPYSFICFESTAKGVGNYFHRSYTDAKNGQSSYKAVFISWFDIESYATPIKNYRDFISTMTDYERLLFKSGATLEQINWYRNKALESTDSWRLKSEFPSFDTEAFQSTGSRYFNMADVNRLRQFCIPPTYLGDIVSDGDYGAEALSNIRFVDNPNNGKFKVWSKPDNTIRMKDRYVVIVDVNRGISSGADNGVICVMDRYWMGQEMDGKPEVVAEWVGHIIPRYFIWIAVKIATWYCNAFLVVESNTPESMGNSGFILESVFDEIAYVYGNMYYRESPAVNIKKEKVKKWGFHTNSATKFKICTHMQVVLANDMYVERCIEAVDEMDVFETKENGSLGAVEGYHDDRTITRALGCWVCYKHLNPPVVLDENYNAENIYNYKSIVNESSI